MSLSKSISYLSAPSALSLIASTSYPTRSSRLLMFLMLATLSPFTSSESSNAHVTLPKQWEYSTVSPLMSSGFHLSYPPYHSFQPLLFFTMVKNISVNGLPRLSFKYDRSMLSVNTI